MKRTIAALVLMIWAAAAMAANWPSWRGPSGQGYCDEKDLPVTWSETENVKWKVPLEFQSNSTPVVWGDKIYLAQANVGGAVRGLVCLARADGKTLWKKEITYLEKERAWKPNYYCNASPVTDGERVVVSFGPAGMYCFDTQGNELWKRTDLGRWEHAYGNASSPVIFGDLAILWCGPHDNDRGEGRNFLLAVDKKTGVTVWERNEPGGSWATPLIAKVNGQDQLLLGVASKLKGFDPSTGNELWFCDGLTDWVYTSVLYDSSKNIAVVMSGAAVAVKLGGSSDITKDRLWQHPKGIHRVGSGVIDGDHVYLIEENGTPRCYELATGREVWKVQDRPAKMNWGSVVRADGRLYALTRDADTIVMAPNPKYALLATNRLSPGEQTNSSLVISDGDLFIRTFRNLWCIREKK